MTKVLFMLAVLLLAGCSTLGLTQTDKRTWTAVRCSGIKGWEDCKTHALKACPNGFDIANQEENQSIQKRTFEYACK